MESCLLSWFAFQFLCLGFCSSGTVRKTQRPSDEIRQECHLNVNSSQAPRDNTAVRLGIENELITGTRPFSLPLAHDLFELRVKLR